MPIDELAARRRRKSLSDAPTQMEAALEEADLRLFDLLDATDGQLLVSAEQVREAVREIDRIVLGCLFAERNRRNAR